MWQGLESFTLVFSPTDGFQAAIQAPNGYFLQATSAGELIANVDSSKIIGVPPNQWGASAFTVTNVSVWGHCGGGVEIWKSFLEGFCPHSSCWTVPCFDYHTLHFMVRFCIRGNMREEDEFRRLLEDPHTIRSHSLFQSLKTRF